jgi:hypothetical protein
MSASAGWQVPDAEMASFCQQFATLLAADVKLMPALITSRQQTTNELLSEVLLELQTELEDGLTLAAAMAKQPDVFSPFAIQMIRQGEMEGRLDEAFRKLSEHYGGAPSGDKSSPVVLHLDAAVLAEALRPFIVTLLIAIGIVGALSAVILVAQEKLWIPEELSGPTILLVTALTLLLAAVVLNARRRGRSARADASSAEASAQAMAARAHAKRDQVPPRQAVRSDNDYLERDPNEPIDLDAT